MSIEMWDFQKKKLIFKGVTMKKGVEHKKVFISIGWWTCKMIRERLESDPSCYIEAYDPLDRVYQGYLKIAEKYPNQFIPSNKAVSSESRAGVALLNIKSTKSTICPVLPGEGKRFSFNKHAPLTVEVISINSILDRFEHIDELHINCEGSEIPMIMENDPTLFERCDFIQVQFHEFVPFLDITKADVMECVEKLKSSFTAERMRKKPNWIFKRLR